MIDSFTEMRRRNALRVLKLIREHGELSRADIARLIGLSKATVSSITAELLESGLLHETGSLVADKGRKPTGLVFNARAKAAVGVAFDGDGFTLVLTDLDGRLLYSSSGVETGAGLQFDAVVKTLSEALKAQGLSETAVYSLVLAKQGPLLDEFDEPLIPVARQLAVRFCVDVPVQTLVDMAAVAEANASNLAEERLIVFMRTSHQLRSSLLMGRRLLFMHAQVGGDPGHIAAPWIKERCACGNVGCVNAHVGFEAVLGRLRERGCSVSSRHELIKVVGGNESCRKVVLDAGKAVGYSIGCLMNILAPITVIVAGFAIELGEDFWQSLQESCRTHATPANFAVCDVRKSSLGAEAPALGAALFGLEITPLL